MTESIFLLMSRAQEEQTCLPLPTQLSSAPREEAKYLGELNVVLGVYYKIDVKATECRLPKGP